jgi:hypothetical protein
MNDEEKRREEEKRQRCWNPVERERVLFQTIDWADRQRPISRNTKEACLIEQARLLASFADRDSDSPLPIKTNK